MATDPLRASVAVIGVCGGYTTWSTFMIDSTLLARDGHARLVAVYVVVTLTCGLMATYLRVWLGRFWLPVLAGSVVACGCEESSVKLEGPGERLTIFVGETDQHHDKAVRDDPAGPPWR